MKPVNFTLAAFGLALISLGLWGWSTSKPSDPVTTVFTPPSTVPVTPINTPPTPALPPPSPDAPLPQFVSKGLAWLVEAQFENGGWGSGSHSNQGIKDPHAVQIDPATTAFAGMALIRAGNTLHTGPYKKNLALTLDYMLKLVENAPVEGTRITNLSGTQPQSKLGMQIDESMAAQFFTKVLPLIQDQQLKERTQKALSICLNKLARAQNDDGSWNQSGGWASVLQSAMANSALEMANDAGLEVDKDALERSRQYQKQNIDAETGNVRTEDAAGISLYSLSSSQRATAQEAKKAREAVDEAKKEGRLNAAAAPSVETFQELGFSEEEAMGLTKSYKQNVAAKEMLQDDTVLQGFGNNGGEEFLSYMMTSEALVVEKGGDWAQWYNKMYRLLENIQNPNGSWSGHHCITSPVFCTVAVIMTMTADRDASLLAEHQEG